MERNPHIGLDKKPVGKAGRSTYHHEYTNGYNSSGISVRPPANFQVHPSVKDRFKCSLSDKVSSNS